MSAKKTATPDMEALSRKVTKALAIVECAMSYACDPNDRHAPYLEPALSAAADLLADAKSDMDKLTADD